MRFDLGAGGNGGLSERQADTRGIEAAYFAPRLSKYSVARRRTPPTAAQRTPIPTTVAAAAGRDATCGRDRQTQYDPRYRKTARHSMITGTDGPMSNTLECLARPLWARPLLARPLLARPLPTPYANKRQCWPASNYTMSNRKMVSARLQ